MKKQWIGLVSLLVPEYEALDFIVGALCFTLEEDTYVPEQDKRWVVVSPPGSNESTSTAVFAAPMNEIPKIVFSAHGFDLSQRGETSVALQEAIKHGARTAAAIAPASAKSWTEPTVIIGDLATGIRRLKSENGKEVLAHGGAGFAQSLVETGLIDEFWLLTHPVAIGQGQGLFVALKSPMRLKLIDTKRFDVGTVAHIYRPE
jgi:hypothetical protein